MLISYRLSTWTATLTWWRRFKYLKEPRSYVFRGLMPLLECPKASRSYLTGQTKSGSESPDEEEYNKAVYIERTGVTGAPPLSQAWGWGSQASAWWPGLHPWDPVGRVAAQIGQLPTAGGEGEVWVSLLTLLRLRPSHGKWKNMNEYMYWFYIHFYVFAAAHYELQSDLRSICCLSA